MDALDKMIAGKRAERNELRQRISVLDAEIAALETASQLRPAAKPSRRRGTGSGRTKGAISQVWRDVLAAMHADGRPLRYDDVAQIAEGLGNELAMASVRDRVRNLVKTDLLTGNPDDGFTVTDEAVERFGFARENEGAAEPSEANTGSASDTPGVLDLQTRLHGQ